MSKEPCRPGISWNRVKQIDAMRHNEQYIREQEEQKKRERDQKRVNEFILSADQINAGTIVQVDLSSSIADIQKVGRSNRTGGKDVILIDGSELGRQQAREIIANMKQCVEPKVTNDYSGNSSNHSTYPKRYLERN